MAISLSAATVPCLKSEQPTCSSPSTKLFYLSSLHFRFPANSWKIGSSTQRIFVSSRWRNVNIVADKPVIVDFYATWCGPCQFMVPILNEVSTRLKDKIRVVKINTEKYPSIANQYTIEALPTFILFKDGKPYDRSEGAFTANQLIQRIKESLKVKQ